MAHISRFRLGLTPQGRQHVPEVYNNRSYGQGSIHVAIPRAAKHSASVCSAAAAAAAAELRDTCEDPDPSDTPSEGCVHEQRANPHRQEECPSLAASCCVVSEV